MSHERDQLGQTRVLRMVVASPADVRAERDRLEEVVADLNRGVGAVLGVRIELGRWETDAYPGFHHGGPQGLIDPILRIEDCDVLVGIFWKRIGSPTADAVSGTVHEFLTAFKAWKMKGRPQIMVYFNQDPYTAKSKAETDQWGLVLKFQEDFPKEGLWWPYEGKEDFEKQVRGHLTNFIRREFAPAPPVALSTEAQRKFPSSPLPEQGVTTRNKVETQVPSRGSSQERIIRIYKRSLPATYPWHAARDELQLFADLGVKRDLALAVIAAVDEDVERPRSKPEKPTHVVVFAGHRVDEPGRAKPRFPASQEGEARRLIRDALKGLLSLDQRLQGLASASPGADILFHEICRELDVASTLCLPMPARAYARLAFLDLDDWRSRFLDLEKKTEVIELSNLEGLPRWLRGANVDPWERGNRWVLQMALGWKADKVTLLALWDGQDSGLDGGTAQMVRLARDTGKILIKIIDARNLF